MHGALVVLIPFEMLCVLWLHTYMPTRSILLPGIIVMWSQDRTPECAVKQRLLWAALFDCANYSHLYYVRDTTLGAPRSTRICVVLTLPTLAAHISRSIVSAPLPGSATKRRDWAGGVPALLPGPSVTTCSNSAAGTLLGKLRSSRMLKTMLSYLHARALRQM